MDRAADNALIAREFETSPDHVEERRKLLESDAILRRILYRLFDEKLTPLVNELKSVEPDKLKAKQGEIRGLEQGRALAVPELK